jgi:hypothetical protein
MTLPAFVYWIQSEIDAHRTPQTPEEQTKRAIGTFSEDYWRNDTGSELLRKQTRWLDAMIKAGRLWTLSGGSDEPSVQDDAAHFLTHLIITISNVTDPIAVYTGVGKDFVPVNLMHSLFAVQTRTTWTCDQCGTAHQRPVADQQDGLPLYVADQEGMNTPRPVSDFITQSFHTTADVRCGNAVCNPSAENRVGTETTVITAAPEFLILRLNSFDGGSKKLPNSVDILEWLDLGPYLSWTLPKGSKYWYKLVSIVQHNGATTRAGHYTGAFRAPPTGRSGKKIAGRRTRNTKQPEDKKGRPFDQVDDENVTPMDLDEYKQFSLRGGSKPLMNLPYVVTYQRW